MSPPPPLRFDSGQIFTFLWVTLGPLRLIAPFAKITAGRSDAEARKFAATGTLLATIAVVLAAFIGAGVLRKWGISVGALAIAAGLILFCVALPAVLSTGKPAPDAGHPEAHEPVDLTRAVLQLMVSPYGIAALILFATLMPDQMMQIFGILLIIMVLNLLALLFARPLLGALGMVLMLVGMIFGVLQVALSIQVIYYGVRLFIAR